MELLALSVTAGAKGLNRVWRKDEQGAFLDRGS